MNTVTFHSQGQLERRNLRAKYVKVKELIKEPEQLVIIFEIDSAIIYMYVRYFLHVDYFSMYTCIYVYTRDIYIYTYTIMYTCICTH